MRRWLALSSWVVALGYAPVAAAQVASRAEIDGRLAELLSAFRSADNRGVASIFADDASILGPNGVRVVGRAAIDSYWVARPRPTSWTIETLEVGGSRDSPWQLARSTRINRSAAGADTSFTTFILVWKRGADGKLRIYLDLYT